MFRLLRQKKVLGVLCIVIGLYIYGSYRAPPLASPHGYQRVFQLTLAPLLRGVDRLADRLRAFYQGYVGLRQAGQESRLCKAELERLEGELGRLQEENIQWRLRQEHWQIDPGVDLQKAHLARVIAYDAGADARSVTIDLGEADGVKPDQVALATGALVGRVLRVSGHSSQVLLITDPRSAVDVLDMRTRARGTLVGLHREMGLRRERWLTRAEYVEAAEEVRAGDKLVTSGLDGVFPKGIPVGEVTRVEKDATGIFATAEVEPQVEMSKLEELLLIEFR